MHREIVTDPLDAADLWADLRANLARLAHHGVTEVRLFFGFAWGRYIYDGLWREIPVAPDAVPAMVVDAERQGFGRLGDDNLYLTIAPLDAKLLYSHERDIHLCRGQDNRFTAEVLERWRADGWLLECARR
jgi:hypothetical protein